VLHAPRSRSRATRIKASFAMKSVETRHVTRISRAMQPGTKEEDRVHRLVPMKNPSVISRFRSVESPRAVSCGPSLREQRVRSGTTSEEPRDLRGQQPPVPTCRALLLRKDYYRNAQTLDRRDRARARAREYPRSRGEWPGKTAKPVCHFFRPCPKNLTPSLPSPPPLLSNLANRSDDNAASGSVK